MARLSWDRVWRNPRTKMIHLSPSIGKTFCGIDVSRLEALKLTDWHSSLRHERCLQCAKLARNAN